MSCVNSVQTTGVISNKSMKAFRLLVFTQFAEKKTEALYHHNVMKMGKAKDVVNHYVYMVISMEYAGL